MAEVDEDFPVHCQIYDLSEFLQVLSVFDSPYIKWEDNYCVISSKSSKVKYGYGEDEDSVMPKPPKTVKERDYVASFTLSEDDLSKLMKMAKILPEIDSIGIYVDGGKGDIILLSSNGPNRSEYSITFEPNDDSEDISVVLKLDDMRMIPLDYMVELSEGAVRFSNDSYKIWYMIAPSDD
jgi:hypothetical protein